MRAAGLTRGGFYAHFDSKEALVREVLRIESGLLRKLRAVPQDAAATSAVAQLFGDYLDPAQRAELIHCPLVAHPADVTRGDDERAALYEEQVRGLIGTVGQVVDEREAILVTVLAVGAAILSSTLNDEELADRIESACSDEIRRKLHDRDGT